MKKNLFVLLLAIQAFIGSTIADAQYTMLYDFTSNNILTGAKPQWDQNLISLGGNLYGLTRLGGTSNFGTIFTIKPDGTGYSKLLDFDGSANGSYPSGTLISDGIFLYGMTNSGGRNNMGTIFKIKIDGSGYFRLLDFGVADNGMRPLGSLISDGTFLYGMTQWGGTNDKGTVFKIKPDGTGYSKLLDFDGSANGSYPSGTLISDGIFLYGMTNSGGRNNMGTIFKIKIDGSGYSNLLDFEGTDNGSYPIGSLISDGTFLYGMTSSGSINHAGTLFKIKSDGTNYSKLMNFAGFERGGNPIGSLISDGTFFYGMTSRGGIYDVGTIFKIKPDGSSYSNLLDFGGTDNGSGPLGSLISDGTFLYGMTERGGTSNMGSLFKIKPDGSSYSNLFDFVGAVNGIKPSGSLISDGTFLYGLTSTGGINDKGTLFKIKSDGTGYFKLINFEGFKDGGNPWGSLISDGTFFYGMTSNGGTYDMGTIFKIRPDGSGYSKLLDFAGAANGSYPYGSLIFDGTFIYGMTNRGGTYDKGTIFKLKLDGTDFLKLLDFSGNANGSRPYGSLISDGTFIYGTTYLGGVNDKGTIFKINNDGSGFTKLLDFDGVSNGSKPADLVSDGTFLYGTTSFGGVNDKGTIFKIKHDGTRFTKLLDFDGAINGAYPVLSLVADGVFLYGITNNGGVDNKGTMFKIKPDGTGFVKLLNFNGIANGSDPNGSLISDGTYLYGMTATGGSGNAGTIYKYQICSLASSNPTATNVCTANSVFQNTQLSSYYSVYPNPNNGIFKIESAENNFEVVVINMLGEKIYSQFISSAQSTIDLSSQSNGIYFITLKTDKGESTKKIIINK